jgi:spermidine synthase
VGSLLAPFVLAFLVVPWLGVAGAWLMLAVIGLGMGVGLLLYRKKHRLIWLGVACAVLLAAFKLPLEGALGSGTRDLIGSSVVLHQRPDRDLIAHETDAITTASVVETADGERILYTDDFAAAATGQHYRYMRMLGHLPAILAGRQANAMVIAFGTGTTASAVAAHKEVKRLEVVEVSQAVLDLAPYFEQANRRVLDDKRVTVIRDDGRDALLLHAPDLDIITLEPLMPYSPHGLPFYTKEFYELARDRLREGGVICQWVPVHAMRADLYAAFVRTFFEVFPDGTLWFFEQSSALIGRKGKSVPSPEELTARAEAVGPDLLDAGFEQPMAFRGAYLADGKGVLSARVPAGGLAERLVTDSDPFPEFHPTPRASLNTTWLADTLGWLESLADPMRAPAERGIAFEVPSARAATKTALAARAKQARADWHGVFANSASLPIQMRAAALKAHLEFLDEAAVLYDRAIRGQGQDLVLRRRYFQCLRRPARVRADAALRMLAQLPESEHPALLKRTARQLKSVLPPEVSVPEPPSSERTQASLLYINVLLRLGRHKAAVQHLFLAANGAADPDVRASIKTLRQALQARRRGPESTLPAPSVPPSLEWVLDGEAAPGTYGVHLVAAQLDEYKRAIKRAEDEPVRMRRAAQALESATLREDLQREVSSSLGTVIPTDPYGRAQHAALLVALEWTNPPTAAKEILFLLKSTDARVPVAMLEELGRRRWLDRFADWVPADDAPASVLKAYATASSDATEKRIICRVVGLLVHENRAVRTAAVAALFTREGGDVLFAEYDPSTPSMAEHEAMQKRAALHFGCK